MTRSPLDGMDIPHQTNVALGPYTWYGVGGSAAVLAHPRSVEQLAVLVRRCRKRGEALRVLGSGANLLVSDRGVDGVVVQLDGPAFRKLEQNQNALTVGGGSDLMKLVLESARRGLAGLEVVAGIPASVGGALRMNAGGAFGEIGASVRRVRVMSETGEVYDRTRDDLRFGYRHTDIAAPLILEVEFDLARQAPEALMKRVKEIFTYKKATQPMAENSAGCAFTNPQFGQGRFGGQGGDGHENTPARPLPSAGALIESAGLKGHRLGGAEVSEKHANFIFTHKGCTADDVLRLIEHIQQVVLDRHGVALRREVVVWP